MCISGPQSTDTQAQQFLGTEQVSSANSYSLKFNLVRKLSDPGGTIGKNYKTINFCFWIYNCVHLIFS